MIGLSRHGSASLAANLVARGIHAHQLDARLFRQPGDAFGGEPGAIMLLMGIIVFIVASVEENHVAGPDQVRRCCFQLGQGDFTIVAAPTGNIDNHALAD